MEQILNDNLIILNRGDTFSRPLFLNKGTSLKPLRYVLSDNDEVYFALMEPNQPFELAIVKKKYTKSDLNENNDVVIELKPEDTAELVPGQYFFTVKLRILKDKYNEVSVTSFTTTSQYVGYYILKTASYILITNDNKDDYGIVPGTTKAYVLSTEKKEIINTVIPNTEFRIID